MSPDQEEINLILADLTLTPEAKKALGKEFEFDVDMAHVSLRMWLHDYCNEKARRSSAGLPLHG